MEKRKKNTTRKTIKNAKTKKQTPKKRPHKKAFTLIELLAVIVILGLLMLIAIPSVTMYINESRKSAYIDTAKQYIRGATNLVNSGELDVYDPGATYYIPSSCIGLETGGNSPFGEFDPAYIIVTYDNNTFNYYWISRDTASQGIRNVTASNDLDSKLIEAGVTKDDVDVKYSVGDRDTLMLLNDGCRTFEQKAISDNDIIGIPDGGETGNPGVVIYPEGKTKTTVETGNIVKIGTEEFYVLRREGRKLVLLSRYNLKVGNIYDGRGLTKIGEYSSTDEGYGKQSSEAKGDNGTQTRYGTIKFSSSSYWDGKIGTDYPGSYCEDDVITSNGTCANVYDSNSNLYSYVQSYKNILEGMGASIRQIRLLDFSELSNLGCRKNPSLSCFNAPAFLSETSYWVANARSTYHVVCVHSDSHIYYNLYYNVVDCGIRPVIEI